VAFVEAPARVGNLPHAITKDSVKVVFQEYARRNRSVPAKGWEADSPDYLSVFS
jgi:hypothetical protein